MYMYVCIYVYIYIHHISELLEVALFIQRSGAMAPWPFAPADVEVVDVVDVQDAQLEGGRR